MGFKASRTPQQKHIPMLFVPGEKKEAVQIAGESFGVSL